MGSNTSKSCNDATVLIQKSDIGTNSDPRSPTPEIIRTPLQGKTGAKHNITKNADLRKNFEEVKGEEKLIHNNPILSAVIKNHLQSYDPRSPTQQFERTPIVIGSKLDNMTHREVLRHQNDNHYGSPSLKNDDNENYDSCVEAQESPYLIVPKNLCNDFLEMTLDDTIKDPNEPLGSSTASNEAIENNINENADKPTQLLETNFDYVDTSMEKFEDGEECAQDTDQYDKTEDEINNIPVFQILDSDPRSPSIGIERTPIVVAKIEEDSTNNVEEMSDDSLIKVLQSTNVELRQIVTRPFDNPEGLLIYEDDCTDQNNTPKEYKSASSSGSRTPLSCMKNKTDSGHTRSKSANTQQDPKNKKTARRVSYIPRLKSLSRQTKLNPMGSSVSLKNISRTSAISGDCENTPPHSHRDKWDKDNSIVL